MFEFGFEFILSQNLFKMRKFFLWEYLMKKFVGNELKNSHRLQ
jgi:hypothetical protein